MTSSISIEDFITVDQTPPSLRQIKSLIGVFFISPLFLSLSILIYFFVPQKLIRFENKVTIQKFVLSVLRRSMDVSGALIGLVLTVPLFIIIPLIIKLDSRGPVFYKQERVGVNRRSKNRRNKVFDLFSDRRNGDRRAQKQLGKSFTLYKFRTMREDAEKKTGPVWAIQNDPRITNVGKFLRGLHLDEIPQLFNILKGDMSFVGPRPERPYFVKGFSNIIADYHKRFSVKPGLTGWAQINCGYDTSVEDVKKKLRYEIEYIEKKCSVYFDFQIISKTLIYLFNGKNGINKKEQAVSI